MKTFTQEEWSELTKDDAILNFVSNVNDEAVKKDYWRSNYALALYNTFVEQANLHSLKTYADGDGEGIRIIHP